MTNGSEPIPFVSRALQQQAHAWVVHFAIGEPTVDDVQELTAWRTKSEAHETALRDSVALWSAMEPAGRQLQAETGSSVERGGHRPSRRLVIGGAIAASIAGGLVVRPPLGLWPSLGDLVQDAQANYRTGPGQQQAVTFSSDVTALLNTRTRLAREDSAPWAAKLLSGEALFTVRPSASAFSVGAGAGHAEAEGAVFNIRVDDAKTSVTCLSGEVRIQHKAGQAAIPRGAQLIYTAAELGQPRSVDITQVTAWRRRLLVFHDTPVSLVVAEMNRYRPGRIVLLNDGLAERRVNGFFRIDRLENILAQLKDGYGARLHDLPGGVVVVT